MNKLGFKVTFSRCLPHCINLVVGAFLQAFDKEYKLASNLKALRGLLNAGGGPGKKLLALEYGLSAARIDFTDTRWGSLVKALLYLARAQTQRDLHNARERLQELADAGDQTAVDALQEEDKFTIVFNQLYHFIESIAEADLEKLTKRKQDEDRPLGDGDANLVKNRKQLLQFFSNPTIFAAVQLLEMLLGGNEELQVEPLTAIFTMSQGSHKYNTKLESRVTGETPRAAKASRGLLTMLLGLFAPEDADEVTQQNVSGALDSLKAALQKRLEEQSRVVVDTARAAKERLFGGVWDEDAFGEPLLVCDAFESVDVPKFLAEEADRYPAILESVFGVLGKACKAVYEAEGLKKMEECVSGLQASQHFDVNKPPPGSKGGPPGLTSDAEILSYLECSEVAYEKRSYIILAWKAYVAAWTKPMPKRAASGEDQAKELSPREVYDWWKKRGSTSQDTGLRLLCEVAMRSFSRPISAACCERIFSFLEKMDDSDRRSMMKETLRRLLFLRGNWHLLDTMLKEEHAAHVFRHKQAGNKRARRRAAAAEAKASAAAATSARGEDGESPWEEDS